MFSNTMIPCIIYYSQNTCSVRDAIVFPLIDDFEETGENDSNTLPVSKTRIFFWKTEEKSPFSKISEYVWTDHVKITVGFVYRYFATISRNISVFPHKAIKLFPKSSHSISSPLCSLYFLCTTIN